MKVATSKKVIGTFPKEAAANAFIQEFKEWKLGGEAVACSYLLFGKDVATKVPVGHDFDFLNHTHLIPPDNNKVPEDVLRLNRWLSGFYSRTHNQRCSRSSDRILYYAGYKGDVILLAIDTHAAMSASGVAAMCALADKWVAAKRAINKLK